MAPAEVARTHTEVVFLTIALGKHVLTQQPDRLKAVAS
jgi:hypothetical protein